MLLTFSFKNFGPYRDETIFDMRAVRSYKEHEQNLRTVGNEQVLKTAAIFGANASGKSQLVKAYGCFFRIVDESFRNQENSEGDGKPDLPLSERGNVLRKNYHPFLFSSDGQDEETEFEGTYSGPDGEYRYGFTYTAERITSEWLYFTNEETGRQSTVLERSTKDMNTINLGYSVRSECRKYIGEIPDDVLALSFFDSLTLTNKLFSHASDCVLSVLPVGGVMCEEWVHELSMDYFTRSFESDQGAGLVKFLNGVDVAITGFTVDRHKDHVQVLTHHKGPDGIDYTARLSIESDGTLKLIALYRYLKIVLEHDVALLIDELDAELHPLLLHYILKMFQGDNAVGQLIFTAHDVTLLDRKYLRRDQIWLVDKDGSGVSSMHSLSEYKVRNDASFGSSYLSGVFSGIPLLTRAAGVEE
ncbi:MAG: ATP-binding protein [Atopobiaceae bacterium]|jgi:AAA15 family ATPase/GTPase|nr:ATP-binding protein [Atopobiaceae bacterium]MCH4215137.1 ATP-binding protein [Atopobiaceae bacterium]MCH4277256.1 ATP-binding protein [Atopobiaceae bacterium]MCI1225909.1 ATP-binding protein [Atopobiaceae bacterium]MDD2588407.1 ATP-binding protein [Atopobiaceae bacterium]